MCERIRLLLIDHPKLSRRGLAALLTRRRGLRVIGDAENGTEALALAETLRPDVVVVDTRVPGGGPRLVADLHCRLPRCAVVVLTHDAANDTLSTLLEAGARGYMQKTCEPDDLVRTIQRVHSGELVVALPAADLGAVASSPTRLTTRQLQVLRLVAHGRTNLGIAQKLGITEYMAKEHLANILDKLGLENRAQIAAYAVQHGLAGPRLDYSCDGQQRIS